MSLHEGKGEIKPYIGNRGLLTKSIGIITRKDIFIATIIFCTGISSFFIGRMSLDEKREPIRIEYGEDGIVKGETVSKESEEAAYKENEATETTGMYVGSKNSDKFHLPWCSGAQRISEENKIWFTSKEEALAKGYTPAANCKGI